MRILIMGLAFFVLWHLEMRSVPTSIGLVCIAGGVMASIQDILEIRNKLK